MSGEKDQKSEQQHDARRDSDPDIANLSISEFDFVSSYNEATHGPLKRGKVKWFNVAKGWGFITPNDGSPDVFVHQSTIQMPGFRSLGENEEVEFTVREGRRGLETTLVQGLEGAQCLGSQTEPSTSFRPRRRKCYNCQNFGHFARDCPESRQPKRCHHCNADDHLVADCPTRPERAARPNTSREARNSSQ